MQVMVIIAVVSKRFYGVSWTVLFQYLLVSMYVQDCIKAKG